MALTDADRMQMALMAVMRHNVITITGPEAPTWFGGVKKVVCELVYETALSEMFKLIPSQTWASITVTSSMTFADYAAL